MTKKHIQSGQVGWVHYRKKSRLGPYLQPFLQLIYVHQGKVHMQLDGKKKRTLSSGMAGILLPNENVYYEFDSDTIHGWCQASLHEVGITKKLTSDQIVIINSLFIMSDNLKSLVNMLEPYALGLDKSQIPLRDALVITTFMQAFLDSGFISKSSQQLPKILERALAYIHDNPTSVQNIASVAEYCSISAPHLSRLFREHLRTTVMRYVWEYKLLRSENLLTTTAMSISEIAYSCGFSNVFHFSRRFKIKFSHSPKEYRRLHFL